MTAHKRLSGLCPIARRLWGGSAGWGARTMALMKALSEG
jgi:hypothetical protein